ncbi:MAG: EpsG family protein [Muribaculaceae bacterium]|nr:EpsG family protein [Muribaculaceae bacterium]
MEYLFPILLTIVGIVINNRLPHNARKVYYILLLASVVLILGFRFRVGSDTLMYMSEYKKVRPLADFFSGKSLELSRFEPGYLFVTTIVKSFTDEFWPVQVLMATITNGGIFIFIWRNCKNNPFWGALLYLSFLCIYFSVEIMRESAAISIFLLNSKNLQEKKWLRYYLFVPFSIVFHYSAIIIVFFPLVRFLKANYLFIGACLFFLAITPVVESLNQILGIAAITERVGYYSQNAGDINLNWKIGEIIRAAFPAIAVLLMARYLRKDVSFKSFILLQIVFCAGAFAIPIIFQRFINYTFLFVLAAGGNLLWELRERKFLQTAFVCFMLLTQVNNYRTLYHAWFPYYSVFNPVYDNEREMLPRRLWK